MILVTIGLVTSVPVSYDPRFMYQGVLLFSLVTLLLRSLPVIVFSNNPDSLGKVQSLTENIRDLLDNSCEKHLVLWRNPLYYS